MTTYSLQLPHPLEQVHHGRGCAARRLPVFKRGREGRFERSLANPVWLNDLMRALARGWYPGKFAAEVNARKLLR